MDQTELHPYKCTNTHQDLALKEKCCSFLFKEAKVCSKYLSCKSCVCALLKFFLSKSGGDVNENMRNKGFGTNFLINVTFFNVFFLFPYRMPIQFSSPPYMPPHQMQRSFSSPDHLSKHAMVTLFLGLQSKNSKNKKNSCLTTCPFLHPQRNNMWQLHMQQLEQLNGTFAKSFHQQSPAAGNSGRGELRQQDDDHYRHDRTQMNSGGRSQRHGDEHGSGRHQQHSHSRENYHHQNDRSGGNRHHNSRGGNSRDERAGNRGLKEYVHRWRHYWITSLWKKKNISSSHFLWIFLLRKSELG